MIYIVGNTGCYIYEEEKGLEFDRREKMGRREVF